MRDIELVRYGNKIGDPKNIDLYLKSNPDSTTGYLINNIYHVPYIEVGYRESSEGVYTFLSDPVDPINIGPIEITSDTEISLITSNHYSTQGNGFMFGYISDDLIVSLSTHSPNQVDGYMGNTQKSYMYYNATSWFSELTYLIRMGNGELHISSSSGSKHQKGNFSTSKDLITLPYTYKDFGLLGAFKETSYSGSLDSYTRARFHGLRIERANELYRHFLPVVYHTSFRLPYLYDKTDSNMSPLLPGIYEVVTHTLYELNYKKVGTNKYYGYHEASIFDQTQALTPWNGRYFDINANKITVNI